MRFRSSAYSTLVRPLLPTLLFLFAALSVAPAQTAPSTVNFRNQFACCPGGDPNGAVTGDFNEDGRVDVAILDTGNDFIWVMRNDGAFQFSTATIIERVSNGGDNPNAIVAGYFDDDTHQDLAVANQVSHRIDIYLGRGDGTFITGGGIGQPGIITIPIAGVPMAMIGANLRNDGRTQLAIVECAGVNVQPCTLDVYQSSSVGAFTRSQQITLPGVPGFFGTITSDDFNLDNKPDIAIGVGHQVMVFRNTSAFNGTGSAHLTLHTTVKSPNGGSVDALSSGHFNAGAGPDLAFEVFDPGNNPTFANTQYVFLNNGNGTFFRKQTITGTHSGHVLAMSDFNGDFVEDLLIADTLQGVGIEYALGRGDGTFRPFQHVNTPGIAGTNIAIVVRDLNRDSRHDFVVTTLGTSPDNDAQAIFVLNLNAAPNCPAPSSRTVSVSVCSLKVATNAVTVKASGNSPNGVKRLELWVDGKKLTQAFNDQISARVSVAAGTRRVTIVAVDQYDALFKKAMIVKVP